MDILACIIRMLPKWNGVVWGNSYEGIKPDISETRPTPSLAELEAVWPTIQAEFEREKQTQEAKVNLADIDAKSVRAIREFLVAKFGDDPLMPKDDGGKNILVARDGVAADERAKIIK